MNYNQAVLEAVFLILAASLMNATYTLPMKLNRKWAWEHSWFAFTLLGVGAVPTVLAILTVPDLFSIYRATPAVTLAAMALFGAGWGVSLVLFGLAIERVGVAVTFAVCLGSSAAAGALIPLLAQHPEKFATREGGLIMTGIAAIFVGVSLCGVASGLRNTGAQSKGRGGALLALLSGVLGSLLNLGLAFGGDIQKAALEHGASSVMTSNAVWIPCLYAGFVPGLLYCLFLMRKHHNTDKLVASARWYYWLMAALMGALWYGSIVLYSISVARMGELGTSIGWPLFLSSIVVASTIVGVLAGEWTGASRRARNFMAGGVLCLVVAIVVLSQATTAG
jgi:L-rhamnose-H+ transport protein